MPVFYLSCRIIWRQFKVVFDAIRQLMSPPARPKREIGFHVKYDDDKPKARKDWPP
jgi:hypothetical protein